VVFSGGCRRDGKAGRVIVLGIDGADPATIDLLLSEGKLPNFAKLRQRGAYGPLRSQEPLLSPILWTTVATGKTPDQHGIGHFVAVNPKTGEQLPVTSSMRRVKALWNILTESGRSSAVVGWWATWPAETIRGSMVSDHLAYHFLMEEGSKTGDAPGKTHPVKLEEELKPLLRRPSDVKAEELAGFVDVPAQEWERPFRFEDDLSHFKWAWATAESYTSIGLHLWRSERPDDLLVYVEGLDSTSHLFGHLFRASGLSGELAEQQRRYGRAVERMYVYADQIVGRFLEALDRRTTLVVLSDHGFELGRLQDDPSKTRDMRRVSERYHRPEGILYLYGNRVRPRTRLNAPTLLDIAPTVLALNGLPKGADMPGRVLTEALELKVPPPVASWEKGASTPAPGGVVADSRVDPEIVKRLQSLGYIGAESPTGDRNIAALHFQAGKYAEAAAAYARLVEADPKDSGLRASFAGALGALGRYDAAFEQLTKAIELDPVNVEAYHNRAVIYERRGDREAAIRDYQTAVRYGPQYEPSRQALSRLGAPMPNVPRDAAQKEALDLADRAAEAARRGDYAGANRLLDEAELRAPRYALVYQYRSNVAYLAGDKKAAIAALRKGLELEPDNALFRKNLERLEAKAP
jgi:arylsulfatase A-like enzyme